MKELLGMRASAVAMKAAAAAAVAAAAAAAAPRHRRQLTMMDAMRTIVRRQCAPNTA